MFIDLSVLELMERSVVRCKTEEHAQMFIDAMWEQYPKKVDGIWRRENHTNWHLYKTDIDGICYMHRIAVADNGVDFCQSTDFKSAIRNGYTIIEFEELIGMNADLGEIQSSDSVCDFFGF